MSSFIFWIVISVALGLVFVIGMLVGIMRKSLNIVLFSVAACLLAMAAGSVAAYKFFRGSYQVIKSVTKTRTGSEVYAAVFGKPESGCVEVLEYFDPVVPVMDDALVMCFKTCPAEVSRILSQRKYEVEKVPINDVSSSYRNYCPQCYTAKLFGDSVWEYKYERGRNLAYAYVSADSTHVFYMDIYN